MPAILSLTEDDCFKALGGFLTDYLLAGTAIQQGQLNRVPEPGVVNFAVMWPLRMTRLATNFVTVIDDIFVASIADTTLTMSAFTRNQGPLQAGLTLLDKTSTLAAGTTLGAQISGTPGGLGVYNVSPAQTVASETMYAGQRQDIGPLQWDVQIDLHGPQGGSNAMILTTLFRSQVAIDAFAAYGFDVTPLYADDARQLPFQNAEEQYEDRWTVEACFEINPIVTTLQQFADTIDIQLIQAGIVGPVTGSIVHVGTPT